MRSVRARVAHEGATGADLQGKKRRTIAQRICGAAMTSARARLRQGGAGRAKSIHVRLNPYRTT